MRVMFFAFVGLLAQAGLSLRQFMNVFGRSRHWEMNDRLVSGDLTDARRAYLKDIIRSLRPAAQQHALVCDRLPAAST